MSGAADDATVEILMRIQGSAGQLREDHRNAAGRLVMAGATAGDVDAHVAKVEERVTAGEARAS